LVQKPASQALPGRYHDIQDSTNLAQVAWEDYFTDPYLSDLIDTALHNNQELNIVRQEIEMARNDIMARKGEYLPFLNIGGAAGVEKVGRYTSQGASDASTEIQPGKEFPDPLPNVMVGAFASWELDIWHQLRHARTSAVNRYLASTEGKNFMVTNLVAELATAYYELLALDAQLEIVQQNIAIQTNALKIVRQQKDAARVTELAVRKFEAEVLKNRSLQYAIRQRITETENAINYLLGRYPQPVNRDARTFTEWTPDSVQAGIPAQLLRNRPDIRQAEREVAAAKLDVQVAKANFYPSLRLSAGLGFEAFNPVLLVKAPQSMLFSLAGDLVAPLVNRNAIKATYLNANAQQIQALYHYERSLLGAYVEVVNQLSNVDNLGQSYDLKAQQVRALNQSINIATNLFTSARADYMEVLLTQRDALEARIELVETKKQQMNARVDLYRALGGGWN
jgi:NodT family efflux transporter outer membrane factor (OMF) lipoprotein